VRTCLLGFQLPCLLTSPLSQTLMAMVRSGSRRVVVVQAGESRRVTGVVTRSAVLAFLAAHRPLLGDLEHVPLSHILPWLTAAAKKPRAVVVVPDTATLRTALGSALRAGVSAVPIVDADGGVVANVSASDVGAFVTLGSASTVEATAALLATNVVTFLKDHRGSVSGLVLPPSLLPNGTCPGPCPSAPPPPHGLCRADVVSLALRSSAQRHVRHRAGVARGVRPASPVRAKR
jgi:CBS domain-containing protein